MTKIKDPDDVTVRRISKEVYEISTMYGGYYRHKMYMGYPKATAIKMFKAWLKQED